MSDRSDLIKERLSVLAPVQFEITDESHLHAGHEGSKNGASHFRIVISSSRFNGLPVLERHRLVYELLHDLIPFPIHALAIVAKPV
ncbi:MAG TPA: BolA family protein [Paralcaligenes sp.]|jgi:BolA protein